MDRLDGWQNQQIYANWSYEEAVRGTDLLVDCKGIEQYSCSNEQVF